MDETSREMGTIEEECAILRDQIKHIEKCLVCVFNHQDFKGEDSFLEGPNIPPNRNGNMKANLTLVFRHLEDARMRLGKVMQAYQGGISILDKK